MEHESQKPFKTTSFIFWGTLAVALLAFLVYAYLFSTVKSTGEHNAALSAEVETLEGQASEVGELKRDLALVQARQPVLVSYFIDANDIVPFLETIEGYGAETNVTTKFNTFVFKRAPDMLAVSMAANGSFADLYHFMALLEAAPYEISMTNVNVVATAAGWEAQISLAVTSITGVPKDSPKATTTKKK